MFLKILALPPNFRHRPSGPPNLPTA
uniref:Uncharacterized protein n=1 Tax=Anguilla anguilla TaxID=7936 RepID=A0A0E9QZT5_ANGAN